MKVTPALVARVLRLRSVERLSIRAIGRDVGLGPRCVWEIIHGQHSAQQPVVQRRPCPKHRCPRCRGLIIEVPCGLCETRRAKGIL